MIIGQNSSKHFWKFTQNIIQHGTIESRTFQSEHRVPRRDSKQVPQALDDRNNFQVRRNAFYGKPNRNDQLAEIFFGYLMSVE